MTIPVDFEEWPDFCSLRDLGFEISLEINLHRELFESDEDRVEILNARAPGFFGSIQRTLGFNIIRYLAAMMEKPHPTFSPSLSILPLLGQATMWAHPSTIERCKQELTKVEPGLQRIRRFRNKAIAHFDRAVFMQAIQIELTRRDVQDVAAAAFRVLNLIEVDVFGSSTAYDNPMDDRVDHIIGALKDSLWLREMRRLKRNNELDAQTAGTLLEFGHNSIKWRSWCIQNGKECDGFLPKRGADSQAHS